MRLVSYNILDGGEGRADPLAEVLIAQRPDIVALIEADNESVVWRIAQRLGMDAVIGHGKKHSVAILSRWPIVESINHALIRPELTGCFLEATMRQGGKQFWTIAALHLHPRAALADDHIRQNEIAAILNIYSEHRKHNHAHILAGDFNSDSPFQDIAIEFCKPATQKAWQENGNQLPRGAIQKLLIAGYIDTFQALNPTDAPRTGTFTTQHPGQRVDYCFAFGLNSRLKHAWVEHDRLAAYASDHFPVGVELD
jgi:endonuclease/exonuclease/phosphatase family metal-dependent hydrolase